MKPENPTATRAPITCALLATALAGAGCQDLNALVTGDPFFAAPQDSPRVEVELVVRVDASVFETFDAKQRVELKRAVVDEVRALADVGMRFYPVLSSEYGEDDSRPSRLMVVRVEDVAVHVEQDIAEEEGAEPRVETFVRSVECSASASVEKRRAGGPPLLVGEGFGRARVGVKADAESLASGSFSLRDEGRDAETLQVPHEDVLDAVEKAVVIALREIMSAVDRDLAAEGAEDRTP